MLENLACNKVKEEEKQNSELVGQSAAEQSNCPCKRTKCERHGKCEECIEHHKKKESKYEPYCMRKSKKK
ncbi:MAG TPA: hypothetical protein DCE48_13275 [Lachnospiraceae bacterium]|uniref:hypothetical protein n=1 Tax=Anaerosporobacter sp. TaxID=1872529 RepID=UPI000EF1093F|nr:hypothetical protein [Anaerosporobacter sp.]HAB61641.1 hypothetical protein [Lachnospiraceae bacterium]